MNLPLAMLVEVWLVPQVGGATIVAKRQVGGVASLFSTVPVILHGARVHVDIHPQRLGEQFNQCLASDRLDASDRQLTPLNPTMPLLFFVSAN